MKFSVCVDAIFNGKDFVDSMKTVKELGFNTIEFWVWWDKDLEKIRIAKEELGITISAFCTKFVSLVDPSKRAEYIDGLKESIEAARNLDCKCLITQVGNELQGVSREVQHASLVEGLKQCAPILEEAGITLLVEPLNTRVDHKGYYLSSSDEGFAIVEGVGSPNIKILFDIYHQQIMEGDITSRIDRKLDKIGHFHAAGVPGRHELETGELNYQYIFRKLDEQGFAGCVGLEYFPVENPADGLRCFQTRKLKL